MTKKINPATKNKTKLKTTMRKMVSQHGKNIHLLRVKHARTLGQRFMGLMGVSPEEHDYALVFHLNDEDRVRASIHMLFMKMPIDVLFLDAQKKIVDSTTLKPWTWNYTPTHAAKYVVELPAHTLHVPKVRGKIVEW